MQDQPAFSPQEVEALLNVFDRARDECGAAAVERLEEAFFGASPPPEAEDSLQRPAFRLPGLTAKPWHDPSAFSACAILEAGASAIERELLNALTKREGFQTFKQTRDHFIPGEHWKTMYFRVGGHLVRENRELCPETACVLDTIPDPSGMIMFSALLPGGHIRPHCGPSNCRITIHLGLVVPPDCGLRVGRETRTWEPGRCLAFDDTFEHESWNHSPATRFVLYMDVWHPDLSDVEIRVLEGIQRILGDRDHPQAIHRVLAERMEQRGHAWWR